MRKGILTTETLGIIIAVIALVGLGFLGVKLYGLWVEQDLKNAKALIEDISGKIDLLKDGESNTFFMRGVEGWVLFGWNKATPMVLEGETIGLNKKPQKCFDQNCLCLCEGTIDKCQERGYCRNVDRSLEFNSSGYFEGNGAMNAGAFYFNCLIFDQPLNALEVVKTNSSV